MAQGRPQGLKTLPKGAKMEAQGPQNGGFNSTTSATGTQKCGRKGARVLSSQTMEKTMVSVHRVVEDGTVAALRAAH